MLDFLVDNPIVAFAVLFALIRFFSRKKADASKAAKTSATKTSAAPVAATAAEEARRRAAERQAKSGQPLEQRLEQLARQLELRLGGAAGTSAPAGTSVAPVAAAGMSTPLPVSSREAASLELGTRPLESASIESGSLESSALESGSVEQVRPTEAIDYDLNAKAFEFHQAIEEPPEKQFHLDAFTGFHSADGARVATAAVETIAESSPAIELFSDDGDLKRAFVLSEVLARPLSLRGRPTF